MKKKLLLSVILILFTGWIFAQHNIDSSIIKIPTGICGFSLERLHNNCVNDAGRHIPRLGGIETLVCGKFKFIFEDCVLGNGIGFDDFSMGASRRQTVCDAYTYLQSVFDFSNIDSTINIHVLASNGYPSIPMRIILGEGTPYYNTSSSNRFIGGYIYDYVHTGINPIPYGQYHGYLHLNFWGVDSAGYNFDGGCKSFDLYSVVLHEATHGLGFLSFIIPTSNTINLPLLSGYGASSNVFSMFDKKFLYYDNSNLTNLTGTANLIKLIDTTHAGLPSPATVGLNNKCLVDCNVWLGNNSIRTGNIPVYSGIDTYKNHSPLITTDTFLIGTSLSHLDGINDGYYCRGWLSQGYMNDYVMYETFNISEYKRTYTVEEIRILNSLGYHCTSAFLSSTSFCTGHVTGTYTNNALIIGTNHSPRTTKPTMPVNRFTDNLNYLAYPDTGLYYCGSGTPTSPITDAVINNSTGVSFIYKLNSYPTKLIDDDHDHLYIYPNSLYNIRGCGINGNDHGCLTVNANKDEITFVPRVNFIGRAQYGFNLSDNKVKGALVVVTIDVNPGNRFNNGSELVLNGGFEQGSEVMTSKDSTVNNSMVENGKWAQYMFGIHYSDSHIFCYCTYLSDDGNYDNLYWGGANIDSSYYNCHTGFPTPKNEYYGDGDYSTNFISSLGSLPQNIANSKRYVCSFYTGEWLQLADTLKLNHLYKLVYYACTSDTTNSVISWDSLSFANKINNYYFRFTNGVYRRHFVDTLTSHWHLFTHVFTYCPSDTLHRKYMLLYCIPSIFYSTYLDSVSLTDITSGPLYPFTVNAGTNVSICSGSSTTLTATPNAYLCDMQYYWSPSTGLSCTTCQSVTATPSSTTTYTVTVIGDGHTATNSVTVTVSLHPPFTIIGDTISCGSSHLYYIQHPISGYTYTWSGTAGVSFSSTTGTSTNVTLTPGFGEYIIYVTLSTSIAGCSSIDSIHIYECCFKHGLKYHDFTDTTTSYIISYLGGSNNWSTYDTININGYLKVDANFTFSTCPHIFMGRGSAIIINHVKTLSLVQNTHLQSACGYMWNGITITDNTANLIVSGSIIEDATNAVVSNGGGCFKITNSKLRNNYRDIVILPYSGIYNSYIKSSILNCTRDLYPPFLYERTNTGITITELTPTWTIGDASVSSNYNLFDNMWYGIRSTKTNYLKPQNLTIVNNAFTKINTSYTSTIVPSHTNIDNTAGICIYYVSNPSMAPASHLTVGGTGANQGNSFGQAGDVPDCYKGIECYRNTNTTIIGNTFANLAKGVYVNNVWREPITISNNTFENIDPSKVPSCTGSWGIYTLYTRSVLNITYNTINAIMTSTLRETNFGIRVSDNNDVSPYTASTTVFHNTTNQCVCGIYGLSTARMNIQYNNLKITSSLNGKTHYGIALQNCAGTSTPINNTQVSYNNIMWDNSSNPSVSEKDLLRGIHVETSPYTMVYDNTITRMGSGIRCYNTGGNPNYLRCNVMTNCYYGVYLDSANIGNQGALTLPWNNQWINNINYRVSGSMGLTATCNWFYKTGANYSLSSSLISVTPVLFFSTYLTTQSVDPCGGGFMVSNGHSSQSARQNYLGVNSTILNNSNVSVYTDTTNEYLMTGNAYGKIKTDTTILHLGFPDDWLYQKFYHTIKASNIKKQDSVKSLIYADMYSAAIVQNNLVNVLNPIETNAKTSNDIYLNTWANEQFVFTPADSATLMSIATQNTTTGGNGVYLAREMLQYFQTDSLVAIGLRIAHSELPVYKRPGVAIYPNPAKDEITVSISSESVNNYKVELINLLGKIVLSKNMNENLYSLSLTGISDGIYICRVIDENDVVLYNDKIVIIK